MKLFPNEHCPYCKKPMTFWNWLTRNFYEVVAGGTVAHASCKVEPKVGE